MGDQGFLLLIGRKDLVMMTSSLKNIVNLGAQGLLVLMGLNQAAKIFAFTLMFCGLVIIFKHFDPINIRKPWAPEITMFCSEVIMTKTSKSINTSRPWSPI